MRLHFRESQRDSILQPGVDRAAGHPGSSCESIINPERVAASATPFDATPLGLKIISESVPRVVASCRAKARRRRALQPSADGRCPVGANPSPPLAGQRRIVSELNALRAEVDALKRLAALLPISLVALALTISVGWNPEGRRGRIPFRNVRIVLRRCSPERQKAEGRRKKENQPSPRPSPV